MDGRRNDVDHCISRPPYATASPARIVSAGTRVISGIPECFRIRLDLGRAEHIHDGTERAESGEVQ